MINLNNMKLVGFLFILTLSLASCKSDSNSATTTTQTTSSEQTPPIEKKSYGFASEEVNNYVNVYDDFINEYKKLAETNDTANLAKLESKLANIQAENEKMASLAGSEAEKLNQLVKEKTDEIKALSKK